MRRAAANWFGMRWFAIAMTHECHIADFPRLAEDPHTNRLFVIN
jgi:hypothetical protein